MALSTGREKEKAKEKERGRRKESGEEERRITEWEGDEKRILERANKERFFQL